MHDGGEKKLLKDGFYKLTLEMQHHLGSVKISREGDGRGLDCRFTADASSVSVTWKDEFSSSDDKTENHCKHF